MAYELEDICFFDTETRLLRPDTTIADGTCRYNRAAMVIILTYAIGDQPVNTLIQDSDFSDAGMFIEDDMPDDLHDHYCNCMDDPDRYTFAAFNTGFDLHAWNHGTRFPPLTEDMVIDVMAQCAAANMPVSLEGAGQALCGFGKHPDGKKLIGQFCSFERDLPADKPEDWDRFILYAEQDTELLRNVYKATKPLSDEELLDWRVNERINNRGMAIDLDFVNRAGALALASRARVNQRIEELTEGEVTAITQVAGLTEWVEQNLSYSEGLDILTTKWTEGEDEQDRERDHVSLERARLTKLIAFLRRVEREEGLDDVDHRVLQVLELREFGGSNTPQKFIKMARSHVGGCIYNQYVFHGASQTGRFSSRGVQVHNLVRSSLQEKEPLAIEMINELELSDDNQT